jgi:hypothetical protein
MAINTSIFSINCYHYLNIGLYQKSIEMVGMGLLGLGGIGESG